MVPYYYVKDVLQKWLANLAGHLAVDQQIGRCPAAIFNSA